MAMIDGFDRPVSMYGTIRLVSNNSATTVDSSVQVLVHVLGGVNGRYQSGHRMQLIRPCPVISASVMLGTLGTLGSESYRPAGQM